MPTEPTTTLRVPPSAAGPELVLGQWTTTHLDRLVEIYQDPDIQRWTRVPVRDHDSAAAWVAAQQDGWATGNRLCFAVQDGDSALVGCVVLKAPRTAPEVGYWTTPSARGRGVATRAVDTIARWAFAEHGVARLELRHQVDNVASCRVAAKAGFTVAAALDGHVHVRHAG